MTNLPEWIEPSLSILSTPDIPVTPSQQEFLTIYFAQLEQNVTSFVNNPSTINKQALASVLSDMYYFLLDNFPYTSVSYALYLILDIYTALTNNTGQYTNFQIGQMLQALFSALAFFVSQLILTDAPRNQLYTNLVNSVTEAAATAVFIPTASNANFRLSESLSADSNSPIPFDISNINGTDITNPENNGIINLQGNATYNIQYNIQFNTGGIGLGIINLFLNDTPLPSSRTTNGNLDQINMSNGAIINLDSGIHTLELRNISGVTGTASSSDTNLLIIRLA